MNFKAIFYRHHAKRLAVVEHGFKLFVDKLEATQHFKLLKYHIKRGQCQFLATFFHTAAVVMLAYVEAVHKQVERGLHEQEDHLGFEIALFREVSDSGIGSR